MADLSKHLTPSEEWTLHLPAMEKRIRQRMKRLDSRKRTRKLLAGEEFADLVYWLTTIQHRRSQSQASSPLFDLIRTRTSGHSRQENTEVIVQLMEIQSRLALACLACRYGLPKEALKGFLHGAQERAAVLEEQLRFRIVD